MAKFQSDFEQYIHRVVLLTPCFALLPDNGTGESKADYSDIYKAGYLKNELEKV